MAGEVKNFDSPDETRPFQGKGQAEILNLGGKAIGKGVFEPGWSGRTTSSPSPDGLLPVPSRGLLPLGCDDGPYERRNHV